MEVSEMKLLLFRVSKMKQSSINVECAYVFLVFANPNMKMSCSRYSINTQITPADIDRALRFGPSSTDIKDDEHGIFDESTGEHSAQS